MRGSEYLDGAEGESTRVRSSSWGPGWLFYMDADGCEEKGQMPLAEDFGG